MSRIDIDQPTPTEEGQYLWQPRPGAYIEVINIYWKPESHDLGITTGGCLVVDGSGGRSVTHLSGRFSKKLFIGSDHVKEIE